MDALATVHNRSPPRSHLFHRKLKKRGKRDDFVFFKTDKVFVSLQEEACTEPWTALPRSFSLLVSPTNSETTQ